MAKGKKLNILHTESMGIRGGQPKRVIEELRIVQELGHHAHLACRPGTWLESEARKYGISILNAPLKRALDPNSVMKLFHYVREKKIDIIHSHNSKDSYSAWIVSRLLHLPFVRARHNDLVKRPGPIYRFSDAIVTTGQKIATELESYGIPSSKIISIPSYPESDLFEPNPQRRSKVRKEYQLGESAVVLGSMTGFNPRKRPHIILEILKELIPKYENIIYILAGPKNREDYYDEMLSNVKKSDLESHFKYVGYVEPASFLDAIDIYLCPSSREGVPQAVMQAMMMGKPVVSTAVGGVPDLDREQNLLLVEPDHPEEMIHHIGTLLQNPSLRDTLGNQNRQLALKYFNRDVMKQDLAKLYESLAG
ncbi:glycosyltransferase family 4 protein [Nitratifractor sp.]